MSWSSSWLIPIIDLDVVRARLPFAGFRQLPATQKKARPLHAAMRGELDRLAPVPVAEDDDRVVALPRQIEGDVSPDPFRRSIDDAPLNRAVRVDFRNVELHVSDFFARWICEANGHRTARTG